MTTYEPDPDAGLTDGCRVSTGEVEGTWHSYSLRVYLAGYIRADDDTSFDVPRGLEQHLTVLVVDNRPTEPGKYEVTWADGAVAVHCYERTKEGRWLSHTGRDLSGDPELRRATFRRLPDRPTEPGWWMAVAPRDYFLLRLDEIHRWHWRGDDYVGEAGEEHLATVTAWYRVDPTPWSPT